MARHSDPRASFLVLILAVTIFSSVKTFAQDPSKVVIQLPPVARSVRGNQAGPVTIVAQQPSFPAEIALANRDDKDWLEYTQVTSRTSAEIVSAQLGWAYVLPAGLEYHEGAVVRPPGGVARGASFDMPPQAVAPRPDAKGLVAFVEQTTFADGTVSNADHKQIDAFYTACCTGANAGKVVMPKETPIAERTIPGGASAGTGTAGLTPNLKPIKFDIVSFRRAEQRGRGREMPADGDFIAYHGAPVDALLAFAYTGPTKGFYSILNEPDWVKNDYYEFVAKVGPEDVAEFKAMTLGDKRLMVRQALVEALKLQVHDDTELRPVYNLVVAKGGPKMAEYRPGDTVTVEGRPAMTGKVLIWFDPFNLTCQDIGMPELVNSLSGPLRAGRVVIDKTGLTGEYDFVVPIPYRPLPEQFRQAAEDAGVPSFLDGLKQLGLALVPDKAVTPGIVIDHIEKPETN